MSFLGTLKSILRESSSDSNSLHPLIAAASSSSSSSSLQSSPHKYTYDVFPSFCGKDVRRNFLSHFLESLKSNGINTFIDSGIVKSGSINSELVKAIIESRIAIVILSKNYASSSWCLDELQLIMDCRVSLGQTVMTVFYDVDPSDIRKQTGEFGKTFEKTCNGYTDKQKQSWRLALTQVAVIAGEHAASWASESKMISKIVKDVCNELPSTDFDRLVGIEAHVGKMKSMICLESDKVKMVGIWGLAGIGKTTIAKALYNQISSNFQLKYYKEKLNGKYTIQECTNYELQFFLEQEILSQVLDHQDIKLPNLVEAAERLKHQRVLLILDDLPQHELMALRYLIQSLRYGSKVIVTSEDIYTLSSCGVDQLLTYKVPFPSSEETLEIFSHSAFGQSSPPSGYMEQASELATFVAPFPLGLKVLGSSLRGKSKEEWITTMPKLKTYPDNEWPDNKKVIKFAYDGLPEKYKTLLYILAKSKTFGENVNDIIFSPAHSDWDVEKGIQTLADRALISISKDGGIRMPFCVRVVCIESCWSG